MTILSKARAMSWAAMLGAAAMLALFSATAWADGVRLNVNGMPEFVFDNNPVMVAIPNTYAYYARDFGSADVYRVDAVWYAFYDGSWYRAEARPGPWTQVNARTVPRELLNAPSGYYRFSRTHWNDHNMSSNSSNSLNLSARPTMTRMPGVSVDGDQVYYARGVQDGDLYSVGTTWYVFRDGRWYTSDIFRGPWVTLNTESVPREIMAAPNGYYRFSRPGVGTSYNTNDQTGQQPVAIYEEPTLSHLPNTRDVFWASEFHNGDLYRYGSTWYVFRNGTWYTASTYRGPWTAVDMTDVPDDLVNAPTGYYRFARNGTGTNEYYGDRTYRTPSPSTSAPFTVVERPQLVQVPNTQDVYYSRDFREGDLYRVGSTWYVFHGGQWYLASSYRGPWVLVASSDVPTRVVRVPSGYYQFERANMTTTTTTTRVTHRHYASTVRHTTRHAARHHDRHRHE